MNRVLIVLKSALAIEASSIPFFSISSIIIGLAHDNNIKEIKPQSSIGCFDGYLNVRIQQNVFFVNEREYIIFVHCSVSLISLIISVIPPRSPYPHLLSSDLPIPSRLFIHQSINNQEREIMMKMMILKYKDIDVSQKKNRYCKTLKNSIHFNIKGPFKLFLKIIFLKVKHS